MIFIIMLNIYFRYRLLNNHYPNHQRILLRKKILYHFLTYAEVHHWLELYFYSLMGLRDRLFDGPGGRFIFYCKI